MSITQEKQLVSPNGYEAWLFDLDGVLTDTASVHASRKNGDAVLQAAGIQNIFEVRVDDNVAAAKKLAGKPSSDTYEEATRMLGTLPEQAVAIEDAISEVQAGRTGGFGLLIGVARSHDPEVLRQNGDDIVVRDLAELSLV